MASLQSAMALSYILIRSQSPARAAKSRAVWGSTIPNESRDKASGWLGLGCKGGASSSRRRVDPRPEAPVRVRRPRAPRPFAVLWAANSGA